MENKLSASKCTSESVVSAIRLLEGWGNHATDSSSLVEWRPIMPGGFVALMCKVNMTAVVNIQPAFGFGVGHPVSFNA